MKREWNLSLSRIRCRGNFSHQPLLTVHQQARTNYFANYMEEKKRKLQLNFVFLLLDNESQHNTETF